MGGLQVATRYREIVFDRSTPTFEVLTTIIAYGKCYPKAVFVTSDLAKTEVHYWLKDLPLVLRALIFTADPYDLADLRYIDIGGGIQVMFQRYGSDDKYKSGYLNVRYKSISVKVQDAAGFFEHPDEVISKYSLDSIADAFELSAKESFMPRTRVHRATALLDNIQPAGLANDLTAYMSQSFKPTRYGDIFTDYFGHQEGSFIQLDDNGHYLHLLKEFGAFTGHKVLSEFADKLWNIKLELESSNSPLSVTIKQAYSAVVGRFARTHPLLAQEIYDMSKKRMDKVATWNRRAGSHIEYRRYIDSTIGTVVSPKITIGTDLGQWKQYQHSSITIMGAAHIFLNGQTKAHAGLHKDDLSEGTLLDYFENVWPDEPLRVTTHEFNMYTCTYEPKVREFKFTCHEDCLACVSGMGKPSVTLHKRAVYRSYKV